MAVLDDVRPLDQHFVAARGDILVARVAPHRAEPVKHRGRFEFAVPGRQLVRELLGQEAIERFVAIEGVDHVVAEPPRIGQRLVVFKTLGPA